MKTLLLLTDFTRNATHAGACAIELATKLKADLLLYHSIQYMPIVPDFANGSLVTETNDIIFNDSEQTLLNAAKELEAHAAEPDSYQPKINCESGEGNLGYNIRAFTARADIQMVVMGGRSGGTLDHLLTGSETAAVINTSQKPVLIIPLSADLSAVRKIAFATDFHASDINALDFLAELAQAVGANLEVVHVVKPGSVVTDIEPELLFRRYLNSFEPTSVSYQQLVGDNISVLLDKYCHKNSVNLLAVTHQQHGWLSSLIGHSESVTLLEKQHQAVLVFPPADQPQ